MKNKLIYLFVVGGMFVGVLLMFRYEKEEIGIFDVRRDRFTGVVYIKHDRETEWKKTKFEKIRYVRAYLEKRAMESAVSDALDQ